MTRNGKALPGRIEAVHRALTLQKLIADQGSISVTEAAHELDVNPSSAQRILATLTAAGFAVQGAQRRYEPGPEMLRPGISHQAPLRVRARPFLERLHKEVGETVHLATLIGTDIHHVDGIEAHWPLRMALNTGVRLPAHRTSAGKVMLADMTDDEVRDRYGNSMPDDTASPKDLNGLLTELARTRARGVAVNIQESNPGVAGMAVSLGAIYGVRAALSMSMPFSRFTDEIARSYRLAFLEVGHAARAALGDQVS